MMKNIHFFPYEKFTKPYIDFINSNYCTEEHIFFLYGKKSNQKIIEAENVINFKKNIKSAIILYKYMIKSEKIIMHSLSGVLVGFLVFYPILLKKTYWVIWGGDLYNYMKLVPNIKNSIVKKIKFFAVNKMKGICTLVQGDFLIASSEFNLEGDYFPAAYINPIRTDFLDDLGYQKDNKKDSLVIQIGNSADSANKHLEILSLLSAYKEEDIKIFAPLSYGGNSEYIESVESYGKKIFKNKFISMVNFLSPEDYTKFLKDIDIAIFANERQQALGNIFALIYLEKKVYIRDDISTWDYLTQDIGITLSNYNQISSEDFEKFKINEINLENKKNILKLMDHKEIKVKWDHIFNNY